MPKSNKTEELTTEISYCPCLGIYHYKRSDGDEFFFDNLKLEESLMMYIQQNQPRDAEFMSQLAGMARLAEHKIVVVDSKGTPSLRDPVVHSFADDDGEEGLPSGSSKG